MPRLTRRALLASSAAALAGCNAVSEPTELPTVTPAPVPRGRDEAIEALTAERPPRIGRDVAVADDHVPASRDHLRRVVDRTARALDGVEAGGDDATAREVSSLRIDVEDLRAFLDRRWDDPLVALDRIRERIPHAGHALGYALALRDGADAEPVDPEAARADCRAYFADRRFACADPGRLLVNAVAAESRLRSVLRQVERMGIPDPDDRRDPDAIAARYRHRAHLRHALEDARRLTVAGSGPASEREPFAAALRRNRARLRRAVRTELDAVEEPSKTVGNDDSPARQQVARALVDLGREAEWHVANSWNAAERNHDAISLFAAARGLVHARAVRTAVDRTDPLVDADRVSFDALERARGAAIDAVATADARVDRPLERRLLGAAAGTIRIADYRIDSAASGGSGGGGEGDPRARAYARYRLAVAIPGHVADAASMATERGG
ncbi:hypothetical protein [Halomarina pelagica]|uniref:hypothetical protein n=1 Tax=Halomarina pelagica TaxID=2961599 RepID=UPI0020C54B90|nr:hypothetical protein [Halomarina sp. BND7]